MKELTKIRIIIILMVGILNHGVKELNCWNFEKNEICVELSESSSGEKLVIEHGKEIFDLNSLYLKSADLKSWGMNGKYSLEVMSGCSVSLCTEAYFQGDCRQFSNTTHSNLLGQKYVSASCKCSENCASSKCSSVILKGHAECARGFTEKDCNTCSGVYLDMNIGNFSFIGSYSEKTGIKSLVVKSGCTLRVYDERDFIGNERLYQNTQNNLASGVVESYKCACDNVSIRRETVQSNVRPSQYPPMISIPDTVEEITSKYLNINETLKDHKGLRSAIKSLENGRSSHRAYMMVLGMTGAGKSASINFLFGNRPIAEIGETESVTSEIHEYTFPIVLNGLGINNSELHVIDTPGLGDTRGLSHDAQFLATLESFMENHEELSSKIPNIVLIFAKFTENRFSGDGANFVKMLRGLDLLSSKLFAKKFPNIVIVLTHYMSESAVVTKNPASRIEQFRHAVEEYSLFPKPILVTVAENQPEDEELAMVNGHYKLPSGELYPRNLFEKICEVTRNGDDPIGGAIFEQAFQYPEQLDVSKRVVPLLNPSIPRVQHYMNVLTEGNFKLEDTNISRILANVYRTDSYFTNDLKSKYPDTLPYIQKVLNVRNIFTLEDVPKTKYEIIQLLKDIRTTTATMALLDKALNIKAPIFEGRLLVGNNYDILKDNIIDSSPFQLKSYGIGYKFLELGYTFPDGLTYKLRKYNQNLNQVFESKEEYCKTKITNMGLDLANVNISRLCGEVKSSSTLLNSVFLTNETIRVFYELGHFQIELNDNVVLSSEFSESVKSLPTFTTHNQARMDMWQAFFNHHGTHVVKSAVGGGALEISLKTEANWDKREVKNEVAKMVELAEAFVEGRIGLQSRKYTILLHGGSFDFRTIRLENLKYDERIKVIHNWKESLRVQPKMFESTVKLISISDIAKRVNPDWGIQFSRALSTFLTSGFIFTPDPEILRLERERVEEAARKKAIEIAEQKLAAEKAAEIERIEKERRNEEELKRKLEAKRLELEKIRKEVETERKRQADALLEVQRKLEAENARKREAEERELRRIAEENRKQLERLAELQRIEAVRLEGERRRQEAAIAEQQRIQQERIARELAVQRQRQIEAEQALQRKLEVERAAAAKAAAEAAELAAAEKVVADAFKSAGCSSRPGISYGRYRRRRSVNNDTASTLSKYSVINTKFLNDELRTVTLDEVALHDKPFDFWVVLFDRVYDVTSFLENHPGGKMVMLPYAGEDATLAFGTAGHGKMEKLEAYLIGVLPNEERFFSNNYLVTNKKS